MQWMNTPVKAKMGQSGRHLDRKLAMQPLLVYTKMAEAPRALAITDALAHSSSLTLPSALGARFGSTICPYFSCLHSFRYCCQA